MAHPTLISYPAGHATAEGSSAAKALVLAAAELDHKAEEHHGQASVAPARAHLVRDRNYLADSTSSETETTANGGPPLWSEDRPSDRVSGLDS